MAESVGDDTRVVILAVNPNDNPDVAKATRAVIDKLKTRNISVVFPRGYLPLLVQYGVDKRHLSAEGNRAWAERLLPDVIQAIRTQKPH